MRDTQLDIYRALAMIYIICVIHVVYWLGIGNEPIKSIILFEMPVIFFITGASFSLQTKEKSFIETVVSRFNRVMMPYYIYALVVLVIVFVCQTVSCSWMGYNVPSIGIKSIFKLLLGGGIEGFPFNSHMWFVKPYMLLSISFFFQKKLISKCNRGGYFLLCIIVFLMVTEIPVLKNISQLSVFFGYNVFMIAGYLFYKRIDLFMRCVFILMLTVIVIALYYFRGDFFPMYENKSPMNVNFLIYGLLVLSILSVIFHYIHIRPNRLFNVWNKNGYTMYLYQNVVYTFTLYIIILPLELQRNSMIGFVACTFAIFIMSVFFSFVTVRIEEITLHYVYGLLKTKVS